MKNEIQVFNYQGINQVRVIEQEDGALWFVAKDVCDVLGLVNARDAIKSLDEDERGMSEISTPSNGGYSKVNIISESGLYTLIMRSNKPEAKQFRKWVTSEVLPTIRKTGKYELPQAPEAYAPSEDDEPKLKYLSRGMFNTATKIYEAVFAQEGKTFDIAEAKTVLALDKLFQSATGQSALEIAGIKLNENHRYVTRTVCPWGTEFDWDEHIVEYNWDSSALCEY